MSTRPQKVVGYYDKNHLRHGTKLCIFSVLHRLEFGSRPICPYTDLSGNFLPKMFDRTEEEVRSKHGKVVELVEVVTVVAPPVVHSHPGHLQGKNNLTSLSLIQ